MVFVFSGENYLIINEEVGPFTPPRILVFQTKNDFHNLKQLILKR